MIMRQNELPLIKYTANVLKNFFKYNHKVMKQNPLFKYSNILKEVKYITLSVII